MHLPFDVSSRWVRLSALLLGIVVLVGGFVQVRAQRSAQQQAAVAEARLAFQQELALAYDAVAEPTGDATVALSGLREVLQQHLALTGRTGEELAAERDEHVAALLDAAARLRAAAEAAPPAPPSALEPQAPDSLGEQLATIRTGAADLADQLDDVIEDAQRWTEALAQLRRSALSFVEVAESHPPTTDPGELAAQWRAEKLPLEAYRTGVEAAATVPGLAPVADAHRAYVEANLAWIDEAVVLLEGGQLDGYNARLDALFAVDDPFGFRAALQSAIEQAFELGVLARTVTVREGATDLLNRVAEARRLTPILLRPRDSEARPASPATTPAPPADATDSTD